MRLVIPIAFLSLIALLFIGPLFLSEPFSNVAISADQIAPEGQPYVSNDIQWLAKQKTSLGVRYFYYPHGVAYGRRTWVQIDERTWEEFAPNGDRCVFLVSRQTTMPDGQTGKIVWRLLCVSDDKKETPSRNGFEIFLPDLQTDTAKAFWRSVVEPYWHELGTMRAL